MKRQDAKYLSKVKQRYKLSSADYYALFDLQGGRCAICHTHQDELGMRLAVDHDHVSGKPRGLLCKGCNLALGMAEAAGTSAWANYRACPPMKELQYRRETPDDEQVHPL